jgi:hypothetical protein
MHLPQCFQGPTCGEKMRRQMGEPGHAIRQGNQFFRLEWI